jgi:aspartyl-tRNA(Asn)/glutamyl-tRNA(Gln) amidotransferase subunit C
MKIPLQEVKYIAELARLKLTEDELLLFTKQLNNILDYMEKLNKVDTRGIKPTSHALYITNALREDIVERSLRKKEAMDNAPQKDGDFFLVPKVI